MYGEGNRDVLHSEPASFVSYEGFTVDYTSLTLVALPLYDLFLILYVNLLCPPSLVRRERSVLKVAVEQNVQSVFFAGVHALTADGSTEGPLDPNLWAELQELAAAQATGIGGLQWCPDAQAVAKQVRATRMRRRKDGWCCACAPVSSKET